MLGPAELVFLLEDMFRKLEFSLTAAPAKRSPFLKVKKKQMHTVMNTGQEVMTHDLCKIKLSFLQGRTDKSVGFSHLQQKSSKDIASCCVELLPALCSHLENCHNHFQVQTQTVCRYERRCGPLLPII